MNFDVFENIKYQNLEKLCELSKEGRNTSDIKLNYSRDHTFVRENLNFLFEISSLTIFSNTSLDLGPAIDKP